METATQTLHRLTSYEPGREWDVAIDDPQLVQDLEVNDLSRLPWFYRRHRDGLARTPLPRELPTTSAPALDVLAGTASIAPGHLDLAQLSRLLHLAAGVVRTADRPYGLYPFRASGSAGGRYPLELYVAVPGGHALPAGVHWYDPLPHELVLVGPAPDGDAPAIVVTGVPWRTGWRYRERGFRHVYWDAGTMLAQLLTAAASAGLDAGLHTLFPDAEVAELVGADGVHEWPVAVVALGAGTPALHATGPAEPGAIDVHPLEFPLVTRAQHAGDRTTLGPRWVPGEPVTRPRADDGRTVEQVILARGSQRRMDRTRGLPGTTLHAAMAAAMRGIVLTHHVVVHDVEGLDPGVYRWPDLETPVVTGDLRDETARVCLDQSLGGDAAFVVVSSTDVGALDDREYRDTQLTAGLVEGRLHLMAYALGASASGMTFLDSDVPGLVGEPCDALLFTTVGVPEYASVGGGQPGAPTHVRTVIPRLTTD